MRKHTSNDLSHLLNGSKVESTADAYWKYGAREAVRREGFGGDPVKGAECLNKVLPRVVSEEDIPPVLREQAFTGMDFTPNTRNSEDLLMEVYIQKCCSEEERERMHRTDVTRILAAQFKRDLPGVSLEQRWKACGRWGPSAGLPEGFTSGTTEVASQLIGLATDSCIALSKSDREGIAANIIANSRALQRSDRYLSNMESYLDGDYKDLFSSVKYDSLQGVVRAGAERAVARNESGFYVLTERAQYSCISAAVMARDDGTPKGDREARIYKAALIKKRNECMSDGPLSSRAGAFNATLAAQNGSPRAAATLLGVEAGRMEKLGIDIAYGPAERPASRQHRESDCR